MCDQCINLTMQGIPDQSHCQLKLSGMGGGDMAKEPTEPIMIKGNNNNVGLKRSLSGCTKPNMLFCITLHNCLA